MALVVVEIRLLLKLSLNWTFIGVKDIVAVLIWLMPTQLNQTLNLSSQNWKPFGKSKRSFQTLIIKSKKFSLLYSSELNVVYWPLSWRRRCTHKRGAEEPPEIKVNYKLTRTINVHKQRYVNCIVYLKSKMWPKDLKNNDPTKLRFLVL